MLHTITPVVTTMNEMPNIQRTLSALDWAADIVIIDSGSTDGTLDLLENHPKVRIFHRPFDTFAGQWGYAIRETGISTPWILRMDADYQLTAELVREIASLDPAVSIAAYRISFAYAVHGRILRASLYPPRPVLCRKDHVKIFDDGHADRWEVDGVIQDLRQHIIHDDRKPISHWLASQTRYGPRELPYILSGMGGLKNRLRRMPALMPLAVFFYCLFFKKLILDGRAGLFYSLQRLTVEAILALILLEHQMNEKSDSTSS
jgi:glycosyltransferase involved in cell wall biosynthesis